MTPLGKAGALLLRRGRERIEPPHLRMIEAWRSSDCTNPAHHPPAAYAPNWEPGRPCPVHGPPCYRCHSCARCRPEQRRPLGSEWWAWLYLAGRGAGKTRAAAETIAEQLALNYRWRIAVLAPTYADARDTCIEGDSGLISVFDRWGWTEGVDYVWNRSLGELRVKSTGSRVKLFSAEKPARLRGPQHHGAWVEELAQVAKHAADAFDMLLFGLRLGKTPQVVCTTTPLPVKVLKDLLADPEVVVTRGVTDSNAANLAPSMLKQLHRKYDGTRLGRQELGGEMLDDVPGALWQRKWLDDHRVVLPAPPNVRWAQDEPEVTRAAARSILAQLEAMGVILTRIVVAVDPAVEEGDADEAPEDSEPGPRVDESGIIVTGRGDDGEFYVLADYTVREDPTTVAHTIIRAYDDWDANMVVAEVNNGGQWIPATIRLVCRLIDHTHIPVDTVRAKKGKRVRAEPVSAVYGQGAVHHVGTHHSLEDQLCTWVRTAKESPDRMDGLVYTVLYLDDTGMGATMMTAKPAAGSITRHQFPVRMPTTSVGARR